MICAVPPSCPTAQPLLPNHHQPKQSLADGGTLKLSQNSSQPNPIHEQMGHPVQGGPIRFYTGKENYSVFLF